MREDIEKLVSKTYDKVSMKNYAAFSSGNSLNVLKTAIRNIKKGSKILDAGCNIGLPYPKYLSKQGFEVTGIDISPKAIKAAKKNVPKARFRTMSMTDLRFNPGSFDMVYTMFAIFHVERSLIPKVIRNFKKVLKKDGILLIGYSGSGKKPKMEDFFGEKMYYANYTNKELKEDLKNNGFVVLMSKTILTKHKKAHPEKQRFIIAMRN